MKKSFVIFKLDQVTIPNPDRTEEWLTIQTTTEWSQEYDTIEEAESELMTIFTTEKKHFGEKFIIIQVFTKS